MHISFTGIPSYVGALYSGVEIAPQALRSAGLLERLKQDGFSVTDHGDLRQGEIAVRHNIPPVRNWPAPRILWDAIRSDSSRNWFSPDAVEVIAGGDCSIIVGTFQKLCEQYGTAAHMIVIDAHFDGVIPRVDKCLGAAASGLWFLRNDSLLWSNPFAVSPSQIHVIGCQQTPDNTFGTEVTSLEQMRLQGVREAVRSLLQTLPSDAKIMLHFDVDCIKKDDMPAAYSPSEQGFTLHESSLLLQELFADRRVLGIEITEFSALHDRNGLSAAAITGLLATALAGRR
ncbi:MAG: arginase family protein [Clostridia bacterium]